MSCGVGHRRGSDLALLWLWCRPAATAPIRSLAWEPLHATGVALEKAKRQKGKKKKKGIEKMPSRKMVQLTLSPVGDLRGIFPLCLGILGIIFLCQIEGDSVLSAQF